MKTIGKALLSGAVAGLVSSIVTRRFDRERLKVQDELMFENVRMGRKRYELALILAVLAVGSLVITFFAYLK